MIGALDEVDLLEALGSLRANGEIPDLIIAGEAERELGFRDIEMANVVREVEAVIERVILLLAVSVLEAHDHRSLFRYFFPWFLGGPAADAAQEMDGACRDSARHTHRFWHLGWKFPAMAVEEDDVRNGIVERVDQVERHAAKALRAPVIEHQSLTIMFVVVEHSQ